MGPGLGDAEAINPRLILLRISGYGQTGPYRDRPGFARIAHAVGGLSNLAGMPDGATGHARLDLARRLSLRPLRRGRRADRPAARRAGGAGQVIDIGLYEAVFRVLDELAPAYAHAGIVREREGAGTRNACPHGHFPTRDGKWVAIACTTDKMFARLAGRWVGRSSPHDDRFGQQHHGSRRAQRSIGWSLPGPARSIATR